MASCTFHITVQDPVSYIQSTEWINTIVSKRSDENYIPVRMFQTDSYSLLWVSKATQQFTSEYQLPGF
jgi:hypothetical protein